MMNQRLALILSALVTAVVMGGVAVLGSAVKALSQASAPPQPIALSQPIATIAIEPTEAPTPKTTEPVATVTPEYPVTSDQAAEIALKAAPGKTLSGTAELVNFQGVVAYEVVLDTGKVYVDANTGKVVFNGAMIAVGPVTQQQAIQIANSYIQDNGDAGSTEVLGVRFGRLRRLRGQQVFEITFADNTRVFVNAKTGEIALVSKPDGDD